MINAKKQRKTIEWERLEIPSSIDTKGTYHTKMSTIKDRNGMDLTEAEDIKKSWHEYIEELTKNYTKKIFMARIHRTVQKRSS